VEGKVIHRISNAPFKMYFQNIPVRLRTTEKELHILWGKRFHSLVVGVDSRMNHVGLLLLDQHHSALNRIFNAKAGNRAGSSLADTMASIGRLPFGSRVPPPIYIFSRDRGKGIE
jgi:hypothetical protein